MQQQTTLGIDIGGTNIRVGVMQNNQLANIVQQKIFANAAATEVLEQLYAVTDCLISKDVKAIGIGVPGLVDAATGTVYDVVNIPAWTEVPLQTLMQERYGVPVIINNDANCFALSEFYFGKGIGCSNMVGLAIGTGLGAGIIINKKIYGGRYCGAGEFGMIEYLDRCYEYYASGQFFKNVYGMDGEKVFKLAIEGDVVALKMYEALGTHLGNAIKTILFALDTERIVLGGSVKNAFPYFSKTMWQSLTTFPFKRSVQNLQVEVSDLEHSGLLGAAALAFEVAGD